MHAIVSHNLMCEQIIQTGCTAIRRLPNWDEHVLLTFAATNGLEVFVMLCMVTEMMKVLGSACVRSPISLSLLEPPRAHSAQRMISVIVHMYSGYGMRI